MNIPLFPYQQDPLISFRRIQKTNQDPPNKQVLVLKVKTMLPATSQASLLSSPLVEFYTLCVL